LLQLFLLQNQSKYGLIWLPKKYKWIILLRYKLGEIPISISPKLLLALQIKSQKSSQEG
jgi:hypothetical protein